ncbi:glycosyltransferase family 4 protein [[Micrococcus luteus] ATCC 49442]|uniref:glycosyltransferase family 4 protein n=1 Tax=[Micrococcus luteus] ATCC 49442 TaxID=2698727 RepID=UPI0013DD095A|nr:glycosyltransferase family 4 protein [[Micrococcus luteus] ATCC 49442]
MIGTLMPGTSGRRQVHATAASSPKRKLQDTLTATTPPVPESTRHIAFVVNNYLPNVGGVEFHVAALAKHLAALGIRVTVFALDNNTPSEPFANPKVVRLKCSPAVGGVLAWPWPGTTSKIRRELTERHVTAISTHTRFFPMSMIGVRLARRLGIPSLHTEHGSAAVRGVSPLVAMASNMIDKTMGRIVLRGATEVLCISEGSKEFVKELAGVTGQVFHNAIDTDAFYKKPSQETAVSDRPEQRRKLVYVGRIVPGKGWDVALSTAETLASDYPDIQLHLVGDGSDMASLEARAATSILGDRLVIHGRQETDRIADLLRGSVFLNPTTLSEGFQTTLLEAVAAGAAIVSTPIGAARYLLDSGADVRLAPVDDSHAWNAHVRKALNAPVVQPARELVESFDWNQRAVEYLKITESCTQAAHSPK